MDEHDDDLDSTVREDADEETEGYSDTADEFGDDLRDSADDDGDLPLDEDEAEL